MQSVIPYNPILKDRAQKMRNNSSRAEVALWSGLKNKQLGIRFVRQKMLGSYIVDFYRKELKLAIEVDDGSHDFKYDYDQRRTHVLEKFGVTVLRISNEEVFQNGEGVVCRIKQYISNHFVR